MLVNPIATSALAGPHRVLTRLTVLHHRAAAALPERAGTGLLRNRLVTRIASAAMVTTPDRALRRWIHAEHDRYFGGVRRAAQPAGVLPRLGLATTSPSSRADVPVPTLLVAAERDDIAPLAAQQALLPRFPDARLVVVPGTGHLAHYEAPAEVAAAISRVRGQPVKIGTVKIALDCRYVRVDRHDGISRYTAGLVGALAAIAADHDLVLLVSDPGQLAHLPGAALAPGERADQPPRAAGGPPGAARSPRTSCSPRCRRWAAGAGRTRWS